MLSPLVNVEKLRSAFSNLSNKVYHDTMVSRVSSYLSPCVTNTCKKVMVELTQPWDHWYPKSRRSGAGSWQSFREGVQHSWPWQGLLLKAPMSSSSMDDITKIRTQKCIQGGQGLWRTMWVAQKKVKWEVISFWGGQSPIGEARTQWGK